MTHDQIDRMVRRANPLPDHNVLGPVAAPVLTTPLERRTDMQTDSPQTTEERGHSRWSGPIIGIAVAAAILIGGAIFFLTTSFQVEEEGFDLPVDATEGGSAH